MLFLFFSLLSFFLVSPKKNETNRDLDFLCRAAGSLERLERPAALQAEAFELGCAGGEGCAGGKGKTIFVAFFFQCLLSLSSKMAKSSKKKKDKREKKSKKSSRRRSSSSPSSSSSSSDSDGGGGGGDAEARRLARASKLVRSGEREGEEEDVDGPLPSPSFQRQIFRPFRALSVRAAPPSLIFSLA